jgi:hypothetical protein
LNIGLVVHLATVWLCILQGFEEGWWLWGKGEGVPLLVLLSASQHRPLALAVCMGDVLTLG